MMWFVLALMTAILWGVTYTCTEQITKHISINTYLLICYSVDILVFLALLAWDSGSFKADFVSGGVTKVWPYIAVGLITSFIACYASIAAVKMGGASFAAIIEISYPLWVIIFTAMLTGKNNITPQTCIGGLIIFLGTLLVVRSH